MGFWNKDISRCLFVFVFGAVLADVLNYAAYCLCKGKRKSHYCCEKLPSVYWLGKGVLAAVFVLCSLKFDSIPYLALILCFVSILYIITLTDLQKRIIPNLCVIAAILIRIVYFLIIKEGNFRMLLWILTEGFMVSVPVFLLTFLMEAILKKEMFGGGDIKLLFVIGLYLSLAECLVMLLVACILGFIGGIIAIRKIGKRESVPIPFGPCLAAGSVTALLFGNVIIAGLSL